MSFKKMVFFSFLFILAVSICLPCQENSTGKDKDKKDVPDPKTKEQIKDTTNIIANYDQWKGLGFGMGYACAFPICPIINGYEIVNNNLRITENRKGIASIVLESHYFITVRRPHEKSFTPTLNKLFSDWQTAINKDPLSPEAIEAKKKYIEADDAHQEIKSRRILGIGPFVCIIPGTDNFLKAIGAGLMFGLRKGMTSNSFNIGVGYIFYSDMNILAEGIKDGQPVPSGVKPVITETVGGPIVMFSFSF